LQEFSLQIGRLHKVLVYLLHQYFQKEDKL
jgi:hypothetical protein